MFSTMTAPKNQLLVVSTTQSKIDIMKSSQQIFDTWCCPYFAHAYCGIAIVILNETCAAAVSPIPAPKTGTV